jgi:predicted amidophosphoribosyltransferase
MIAALEFMSCYVYSPAGAGELCERSRLLRELLKEGNARFLKHYAERVQRQMSESPQLTGFLSPDALLVPVPGCAPKRDQSRYVSSRLAEALLRQGIGRDMWHGLKRIRRVQKSSTAPSSERPSVALHYETFSVDSLTRGSQSLVLVDDVITKGRTLLAAAVRLREAFPDSNIRAFALLRTMGLIPRVRSIREPCRGVIAWTGVDARRSP